MIFEHLISSLHSKDGYAKKMAAVCVHKPILVCILVLLGASVAICVVISIRDVPPSPENAIEKMQSISSVRLKREYVFWYTSHVNRDELVEYFSQHYPDSEEARMIVVAAYAKGAVELKELVVLIADLSDLGPSRSYARSAARYALKNPP